LEGLPKFSAPMDAHSDDTEKKIDRFVHNKDEGYLDPVLVDPVEELTLHRGLKARQISMITVPQTS
jgi:amino acid transporter